MLKKCVWKTHTNKVSEIGCRYQEPKNKGGGGVYGGRGRRTNAGSDEKQICDMRKGKVWWT